MAGQSVWLSVLVCVVTAGATTTPAQVSLPDSLDLLVNQLTSLAKETLGLLRDVLPNVPRSCKELLDHGDSGRGVRILGRGLVRRPSRTLPVYCDHTVDGGGWMVLQRRAKFAVREDFARSSSDYNAGFGNLAGEFWMGLENIRTFTGMEPHELRIDLSDYEGGQRWAKYAVFWVNQSYNGKYRLIVNGYTGDAGDGLTDSNGQQFLTRDRDNSDSLDRCDKPYNSGWWFKGCDGTNLNGYQHEGVTSQQDQGIIWLPWKGADYSLMNSTIMMRPIA